MKEANDVDQKLEGRLTAPLIVAVAGATIGCSFQFGYHSSEPGRIITDWLKSSHHDLYNITLSDEEADFQWSMTMGMFFVGGMLGSLTSGWLADQMGRKGALLFTNLFMLMAAFLTTSAKYVGVYYLLALGRLFVGFGCGLGTGLTPMYLIEISPINLRGSIGSVHQLLVAISMLVGQFLGLPFVWGNDTYWPLIFAFSAVPSLFQLVVLPFCPESPKYSQTIEGSVEQAEKDLRKLRNREDVSAELKLIKKEEETDRGETKVSFAGMLGPSLRWPVFIAITMMLSQQLSGINGALFYSNQIFRDAGLSGNEPSFATLATGAIFVTQTFVSVWLVDRPTFGRRPLHLAGLTGMFFSSILIVFSLSLSEKGADGSFNQPWLLTLRSSSSCSLWSRSQPDQAPFLGSSLARYSRRTRVERPTPLRHCLTG